MNNGKIKVAVITGRHPYDVQGVHDLFRSMDSVDAYIQHMDNFVATPGSIGLSKTTGFDPQKTRESYDVVVFFSFMPNEPSDEDVSWFQGKPKTALDQLGETDQGIIVWHHALVQYQKWPVWSEIVGIEDRDFKDNMDEKVRVEIANPDHPITQGLEPFEIIEEAYKMADADQDSDVLLTVDNENSMRTVAWTRQYKKARVFCMELGHDDQSWTNTTFRTVYERAIQWCAKKI